jgi:hypothetical protein
MVGALVALVLAASGAGWAATRDAGSATITACANADEVLSLSTTGSCPSGNTLVEWNQQGPQGLPGQTGAPGADAPVPIAARLTQVFTHRFQVECVFGAPGTYGVDGKVDVKANASGWPAWLGPHWVKHHHKIPAVLGITCTLAAGTSPSALTVRDQVTQTFYWFGGGFQRYMPTSFAGPLETTAQVAAPALVNGIPYLAAFYCVAGIVDTSKGRVTHVLGLPGIEFTGPEIDAQRGTAQPLKVLTKPIVAGPVR